jgi:RND family efflux transporter MFP subunit
MTDNLSQDLASLRIDRSGARTKRPRSYRFLVWGVGVVALAASVKFALPLLEAKAFKTAIEITEIASVSPAQAQVELTATGYVDAERSSKIAPKVPGRVSAVHVKQGQQVKAGDPLMELDAADDEANILAAKSRVAAAFAQARGAGAQVATARAELADITQQAEREKKLAAAGVTPTSVADDLAARVASLSERVKAAEAAEGAAQAEATALAAQVKVLETGLKNLILVAPIDGTVVNEPPQIGEFVGPQPAGISVDMGGIRIADFSTLLVETDIPEARLSQVKPGAPAEIVLDAYADRRLRGKVKEITPEVDRAKASVKVKVAFVDPLEGVLPDMSARVSFLAEELDEEAIKAPPKTIVPGSAIVDKAGGKFVFVVDGDVVRMTSVSLGPAFGSGFELISGPRPGTRLVAGPASNLADGQRIKEKTAE